MTDVDLPDVLVLNNSALPALSELDLPRLEQLVAMCSHALVLEANDGGTSGLGGFCLTLRPGAAYDSTNYAWFSERYDDFEYLDRIAIAPADRGKGLGAAIYAGLEQRIAAATPWLLCEVNVRPMNEGSLRFHHRLGFTEVGQQDTEGGKKRVSLLAKPLGASSA
jgi:uncharacterized protein